MGNRVFDIFVQLSIGLVEAVGLKTGIPAEVARAPGLDNFTRGFAFEHDHVGLAVFPHGAIGIPEHAGGVGRLVLKADEHLEQPLGFQFSQKPFDVGSCKN